MSSGRGNGGSGGNGGGSFAPTYFEYNDPGGSGYYGLAYRQVGKIKTIIQSTLQNSSNRMNDFSTLASLDSRILLLFGRKTRWENSFSVVLLNAKLLLWIKF